MSDHALAVEAPPEPAGGAAPAASSRPTREGFVYLLLVALVGGAWGFSRLQLFDVKSDIAYWLGVAGGLCMLTVFSYPMRKYLRFMQQLGASRYWFYVHMTFGVVGPVLILLHSGFALGSLNATVAFISMSVVALSGVVGRFLYLRLHRGVSGEKFNLVAVRERMETDSTVAVRLRLAPGVMDRCRGFERWAVERRAVTGAEILRAMFVVPLVRMRTARVAKAGIRRRLLAQAHTEGWSRRRYEARLEIARDLIDDYLEGAQRVATFSAWERVFALWHVAHMPFVYLLVISAIVHVVAVHAY